MRVTDLKVVDVGAIIVKVETDEGVYGLGEATLGAPGEAGVIAVLQDHLKAVLVGRDPRRIEFFWQDVFRGNFWIGGPVLQTALSGVDMALWDILGKLAGLPVYQLLGGACRDRVAVYRHVYGKTVEEIAATARRLVSEGYRYVRGSPPGGTPFFEVEEVIAGSIDQMAALREAIGPRLDFTFDVHTRLNPTQAIRLCKAVEPYRPFLIEDCIRAENPESYALIRQHTSVPLAAGEHYTHKWTFRQLIERELVDYLRVDLSHVGGITEGKKIAAMGEAHYQELVTHHTGGPINTAASLHLNMAIPNCAVQEYAFPAEWYQRIFRGTPEAEGGYLVPSGRPGLGVELDEAALAAFVAERPPRPPGARLLNYRRPDGSVHNW
jgi:L-alanine-DL-glutamate epimerase-like enolase superfamily enzyme